MDQYNDIPWKIINTYFKDNPTALIDHHLTSYNDFFKNGIQQLLKEKNPIRFIKDQDETTKEFQYQAYLYIGGKNADRLYYGKPVIYDDNDNEHIMYPNEARLRNMTYAFTIHFDLEVDFKIKVFDKSGVVTYENEETIILPKIYLGKFPIMLQSDMCILKGLASEVKYNMGECRNDKGGYFIVDGKEKVIICQEKFADNTLYIQDKVSDVYSYSAKIRSVSEDASKPVRTLAVRMVAEQPSSVNGQIVVSIPNVRKPVPLFIAMRALGIISDKEIIQYCLLDLEDNKSLVETFRSSIHDAGLVFTQQAALGYIAYLTKGKSIDHAMEILMMYFLPHIGELNFKQKALYLGYIVNRLLRVVTGKEKPTNRDSYLYKRIEVSGMLIYDLFREYYTLQQKHIFLKIDKEHFYNKTTAKYKTSGFMNLILENITSIFGNRIVENGFRKAFKGDWGSEAHTKRPGLLQDLSRLSYWSFLAQLRKTNLYIDADGAKVIGPRWLNSTQWGILCPVHTPDGGNIGFHKHLSIFTHISSALSGYPFIKYLRSLGISLLEESSIKFLSQSTKIFVNGAWIGASDNIVELYNTLKIAKRNGLINPYISIRWNIERQELSILTDAGRPSHPLFHVNGNVISYQQDVIMDKIESNSLTWEECITGLAKKKKPVNFNSDRIYSPNELYAQGVDLKENQAIVEYLDTQEMEGAKLAMYTEEQVNYSKKNITHIEIHPSVILSVMANQIIYPANNQFPRDLFSCGQSKQAVSVFHTNYQNRMDKTTYFLNYGQIPLVKSRYLEYTSKEQHPYGVNAIVAVMSYTGYNVEDAVIINKSALDRGLFRTTYLSTYEAREDKVKVGNISIDKNFMDVNTHNVVGKKPGYDYSQLDKESGLIKENSIVNDKTILMGMATNSLSSSDAFIDESVSAKKGAIGYIDKSFMTRDEEGGRLAKVRLRQDRIPNIGDKVGSRAGQKGTIGIVLEEADMPTTADGIRPDIIVNPHAFPSRMTIGHLVESLTGKACCLYGGFGDCTAFINKGPKDKLFGDLLTRVGYNSTGNEIMYNGMTGEQLETEIYIGPTYYMRLKHMVKDKINYRARGPRTVLTRQTVQGRANNGGLRVGEMDRDAIIGHGMAGFLNESMMERGDKYFMAICNKSGTIAVYNESRNIFLSPMVDGPLKFVGNLENELNVVPISRFGRDFSIVKVPYAFKLLYQELLTMNVQMRLITADNVNQMVSLTKTENVKILTNKNTFKEVEQETYKNLKKLNETQKISSIDEKTPGEDTLFETLTDDMYAIEEDPWASSNYTMQPFGISTEDFGRPPLTINIPQSTVGTSSVFKSSETLLNQGDKVIYRNAVDKGYSPNTVFTINWISDGEAGIKAPDGKSFEVFEGELDNAPISDYVSMGSPVYDPNKPPSPVYDPNKPPISPSYVSMGSPVYDPNKPPSPVYDPNKPPISPSYVSIGSPVYDPNKPPSVTVTDTRTVTGPPELVLPAAATQVKSYVPQQREEQASILPIDTSLGGLSDENEDPWGDNSSLVQETDKESDQGPENKIIRTVKKIDDNKGLSLLAGIEEDQDDSKKSESDTKSVTTNK